MLDRLLDASILLSFDATGFERHRRRFVAGELDVDLEGRICVVTGANSGIGRETALGLARRGAEVRLLCRDRARGERAREAIVREAENDRVFLETIDLSRLASVRDFAKRFEGERVDVLVHNAGLLPERREITEDGLELTFATHVAGPWLLSRLLEPKLCAAPAARVIFVSSGGMYTQRLSLDDLDWARRPYDGVRAYAQTKRMQVVLAELLDEVWAETEIRCHAMHPGWADTPGVKSSLPGFWSLMQSRLRTPEQGADTVLWLAIAERPGRSSGRFWFDREEAPAHLLPFTREEEGERCALRGLCEALAGERVASAARAPDETWEIRLLYDGGCPLCSREIAGLRRLDRGNRRLVFEDITAPAFAGGRYGLDPETLMARIHGVLPDGTVVEGMEVFRRAYAALGLGWLLAPTRWSGVRPLADRAYRWFARNRLRLTGRAGECQEGHCAIGEGRADGG